MDILDDMGVSKLSAKAFLKVNYSFNITFFMYCSKRADNDRKKKNYSTNSNSKQNYTQSRR